MHKELKAGMVVASVAGKSVKQKSYQEIIEMIKAGGRPLTMTFTNTDTTGGAAPREKPGSHPQQKGRGTVLAGNTQSRNKSSKLKALEGKLATGTVFDDLDNELAAPEKSGNTIYEFRHIEVTFFPHHQPSLGLTFST